MILLRRLSVARPPQIYDSGTQFPFPNAIYPNTPLNVNEIELFPSDITLTEHISKALRSKKTPLIFWGLSNFTKCAINDKKCIQNLQIILSFLSTKDLLMELMVANCLLELSKNLGKVVAAPMLSPILNKLKETPAIEYVQILSYIIPFLTPETINCCIIPLIEKFICNKTESFHYALGELITSTPFETLHITTELLLKILNLRIIINNYLTKVIKSASKTFSKEWIGKILPSHLLVLANEKPILRYGILKTVLSLSDIFFQKYFYNYISSALNWANNDKDMNIELILASNADEILLPKTIELYPKMRSILYKISHSNDFMIRVHLPNIIANNPSAFLGNDLNLLDVFTSFVNDNSPEIRLAFLDSFYLIFRLAAAWNQMNKDSLISLFILYFKDSSSIIRNRLCTSIIYSAFGSDRLFSIMPYFIDLATSINNYKTFSELIKTFISWPNKVICNYWIQIAPIINNAALKWPHAIAPSLQSFYVKISVFINDEMQQKLEEILFQKYASSSNYQMRVLFLKIAGVLCFKTQRFALIQHLWNHIRDYESNDSVVSVRGKVIPQLIKFRIFFFESGKTELENEVTSKFIEIRKLYNCDEEENIGSHFNISQSSILVNDENQNQHIEHLDQNNIDHNQISDNIRYEKDLSEKQYMRDILRENWIIFNKEMFSHSYDTSLKHSKSFDVAKNDLVGQGKIPDHSKLPLTHSTGGLNYHKIKPSKIVHTSKTNVKLMHRKSLGDSKLPPIIFQH